MMHIATGQMPKIIPSRVFYLERHIEKCLDLVSIRRFIFKFLLIDELKI